MDTRKLKGDKGWRKDTKRYIGVQRSSWLFLLQASIVLINHWKLIMIFYYFDKFDTSILITTNYHTIILFVDADTQTANKNKISKDLDPITLLSPITCSKYSCIEIHFIPPISCLSDCH